MQQIDVSAFQAYLIETQLKPGPIDPGRGYARPPGLKPKQPSGPKTKAAIRAQNQNSHQGPEPKQPSGPRTKAAIRAQTKQPSGPEPKASGLG